MSKDNNKTPKKANLPTYSVEQNTVTTQSSCKSSDESEFTLVSYGKKTCAVSATHAVSPWENATVGQEYEETMKIVKTWRFKDFQQLIYPIIQKIIDNPVTSAHPFVQRWCNAIKGPSKVMAVSTFCTVAKSFNLKDLQDYPHFLLTAPNINKYITLGEGDGKSDRFYYSVQQDNESKRSDSTPPPSHPTGSGLKKSGLIPTDTSATDQDFTYRADDTPNVTDDQHMQKEQLDSITSMETSHKICYGNQDDFHVMMTVL
jgi:hypothetical protein